MHAEGSCLVGGGTNDGAVAFPGNDHGFSPQLGIISLLDGGVEGIHVNVDDFSQHDLAGRDVIAHPSLMAGQAYWERRGKRLAADTYFGKSKGQF
jgi:hypothetical protein